MSLFLAALALAAAAPPELKGFTPATCENPEARKALLANDQEEPLFARAMRQRTEDNQKKMDVLIERLAERAKLNPEQRAEVAFSLIQSQEFEAALKEGLDGVKDMFGDLEQVMKSKDERGNCLLIVNMMARLPAIEANADKQWAIMEKALRAEAARRGVSLEP